MLPVDNQKLRDRDRDRPASGIPLRFAEPLDADVSPSKQGTWETLEDGDRLWRLRLFSGGAFSLNLGFTRYVMPPGGRLFIYSPDYKTIIGPFTEVDNEVHGQLWTPIVSGDELVIEVSLPAAVESQLELNLSQVNHDYRDFGSLLDKIGGNTCGACNVDVVCPEADDWRDEIRSVGAYTVSGVDTCSGALVNNTAQVPTPYFLTANHCDVDAANAPSVVVYWNYENSTCRTPGSAESGQPGDGQLTQFNTGAIFRADYAPSDMNLLELDDPIAPAINLFCAGWDNTNADATSAVTIHHPGLAEKRISSENDPTTTTSYYGTAVPGDGTHIRVEDWDVGTTEPGSSGAPLFNQDHRIIGQLHGGDAACGNDDSDWFGRFSMSWTGGGTDSSRLSNWLDPGNTGATTLGGRDSVDGIDAALVIDKSGSMDTADKLPVAKEAAKYFVEASQPGDQIAVSAFSSGGQLVAPLTQIPSQDPNDPVKVGLKNAIDTLTAGGNTNFGAGLQIAYDQLNGSTLAQDKFAVLMSNGQHNTGTYAGQVQAFADKGWPIYTIGFGSNANETTLRSIADDTGGKYYFADPDILTTIYALIRADMTGNALLTIMQWLLQQGQTIIQWLPPIGPLTTLLHFLLNWGGSDVDLILIRPDGTEITPADAALDPNITYHKTATYAFYTVNNPMPGAWGVRIVGTDLPNPEVVALSVTAASSLVFTFYGYQASYNPGDAIPIVVQLREQDRTPILGSNVQVEVTKPNGGKQILPLLDDGASNDALLSDGIYGNTFTDTATEGFYQLDVTATGNYSGGAFNQKLIGIVLVGSPPAAGGWYDMEYVDQDAMETAGWTFSGLWHLATEAQCGAFSPNPTLFPSSTHAAHFCGEGGTYAGPSALPLGAITPKQRAQRAQTGVKAGQAKSYGELITPEIPVTAQSQVDLRFQYFREVEHYSDGSYDQTYVQVQFDGGSWQTVWFLDSKTASKKAWTEAGPITIPVPTGASVMRVKFVFDSMDSYGNNYLGWLIDDISVSGPQPVTLRITTQGLPTGTVNQAYTTTLSAAGGTTPYTWSATGLPSGLSLNASTGVLSGTPTPFGTSTVTATVTDSANNTATRDYQLTVNPEPVGVLYEEDFSDSAGWTLGGLWHTTATLGCVNLTGYGTAAYYGIDAACDYDTNDRTTGELTSPAIDISGATAVQVRFDHFRQVEYFGDGAYDLTSAQVKLGTGPWQTAWSRDSTHISEETWTQATVGPFATGGAGTMQLRFIFDSVDRWANGFIGWLVDNVRVEAATSGGPLSAMAVQQASPRDVAKLITVFNVPNPIRDVHTTQFVVRGVEAETLHVEVYDLTGRLVWEGEGVGNELPWHTEGFDGLALANGVYLYRVIVRVGGEVIPSSIQKLVILR